MRLFVCFHSLRHVQTPRPGGHPCANALKALERAGHAPEVVPAHGLPLPGLNRTAGRREVQQLSGQSWVPVLVTDDGEVIHDSKAIVAWAEAHPA